MRSKFNLFGRSKQAQVTIFIIAGIALIAAVAVFFMVRQNLVVSKMPSSLEPVYTTFLSCIEEDALVGVDILESQAGYIELPKFEPGSEYMPFSSQLDFLGNPIPYWYYVSGNNIMKEQIPSEQDMEKSLGKFVEERISECNFENYYANGFEIVQETPIVSVDIRNTDIDVKMDMNLQIKFQNDSVSVSSHKVNFKSNLGKLYNSAKVVYAKEKKESFLENYAVDTLRLYAPVDGVSLSCSPKTWNADAVFDALQDAIETNTLALTNQNPTTKDQKYFFVNTGVAEEVRFINSRNWKFHFEVSPSEESLLIANPVGNQQGLGILGFCYVPYHFVYDVKYPVLIQVSGGGETFQFPTAVVIQGNKPRVALNSTAKSAETELCQYKNSLTSVSTYDHEDNPVESSISYECFGQTCKIGETAEGTISAEFPQCVNGYILASANGFEEAKLLYSTTEEGSAEIILDKLYPLKINLNLENKNYNGKALVYFISDFNTKVISYPEQNSVNLSQGDYEVSVYIYKDSSIQLKQTTRRECVDVPSSGIFGAAQKNCFDVTIPAQLISNVLAGGGKQNISLFEEGLKEASSMQINAESLPIPKTLEEFQSNYLLFDEKVLEVKINEN